MPKSRVFLAISYTKRMKVEKAIKKYLQKNGFEVISGRDCTSGGNLCDEIINLIQRCDFGVIVYNELRHNISYEWGLFDALKKDVVFLKDVNIHIDLDKELSDKKGIVFTPFYGEDPEDEIIKQLKKDTGFNKVVYLYRGIDYGRKKKYGKTIEVLSKAIELNPNDSTVYNYRGAAYYDVKNFDKAIEDFSKAIELNPNYAGTILKSSDF